MAQPWASPEDDSAKSGTSGGAPFTGLQSQDPAGSTGEWDSSAAPPLRVLTGAALILAGVITRPVLSHHDTAVTTHGTMTKRLCSHAFSSAASIAACSRECQKRSMLR